MQYCVFYSVEVTADTPEAAAREVYDIFQDPEAIPPVLEVWEWPDHTETVPPRVVAAGVDNAQGPVVIDCAKLPPWSDI